MKTIKKSLKVILKIILFVLLVNIGWLVGTSIAKFIILIGLLPFLEKVFGYLIFL